MLQIRMRMVAEWGYRSFHEKIDTKISNTILK